MRASIAVLGSIVMLFIGFIALSEESQQVQDVALNNSSSPSASAYNATNEIYNGLGQAMGPAVVWMGIAAVILIALGLLLVSSQNGR